MQKPVANGIGEGTMIANSFQINSGGKPAFLTLS
jgi:hypothetical protein